MITSSPDQSSTTEHPFGIEKKALVHKKEIVRRIVPLLTHHIKFGSFYCVPISKERIKNTQI